VPRHFPALARLAGGGFFAADFVAADGSSFGLAAAAGFRAAPAAVGFFAVDLADNVLPLVFAASASP
jgi:hypothetical protein